MQVIRTGGGRLTTKVLKILYKAKGVMTHKWQSEMCRKGNLQGKQHLLEKARFC